MHRSGSHALAEIIFEAKAFEEIEPTRSLHYTRKSFPLCVIVCVVASHRTLNSPREMSAVDFRRSEHSFDPDCIHLVAHKEANIYGDFLDDFIVGDWVSQVAPEMEFISPHADKASYLYSRSQSEQLAGNAAPSVVVGVESNSCASTAVSGISRTHFTASPETGFETISRTFETRRRWLSLAIVDGDDARDGSATRIKRTRRRAGLLADSSPRCRCNYSPCLVVSYTKEA